MAQKVFQSGEVIFRKGDMADSLYKILKGSVSITSVDDRNEEQVLVTLGAGDYFGEMAVIETFPRSATATALEDGTTVEEITQAELSDYISTDPDAIKDVMKQLSERLRDLTKDYLHAKELVARLDMTDVKSRKTLAEKLRELVRGKHYRAEQISEESQRFKLEGYSKRLEEHPAGTVLCKEGETGECMYAIHSGTVGIYSAYGTDKERLIATLFPNEFFGEIGMLQKEPRSASVVVINDAVIEIIYPEDLEELFRKNPSKVGMIMAHLSNRLRKLTGAYVEIASLADAIADFETADTEDAEYFYEKVEQLESQLYD